MLEKQIFECPVCCLRYADKDLARQCETWCGAHDSCNLELIKNALPPEEDFEDDQQDY